MTKCTIPSSDHLQQTLNGEREVSLVSCLLMVREQWNKKINRIHERALRLVYQNYTSSFHELLKNDKSLSFHHRNMHQVAIEMYKMKNELSPPFMKEIFCYIGKGRETRLLD